MQNARNAIGNNAICIWLEVGNPNIVTKSYDVWYCGKHNKDLPNAGCAMLYCCMYENYGNCFIDLAKGHGLE